MFYVNLNLFDRWVRIKFQAGHDFYGFLQYLLLLFLCILLTTKNILVVEVPMVVTPVKKTCLESPRRQAFAPVCQSYWAELMELERPAIILSILHTEVLDIT